MQYIVRIQGDKKLLANLAMIKNRLGQGIKEVLDSTAERIANEMKWQAPKGATGDLKESIAVIGRRPNERDIGPGGGLGTKGEPLPKKYAVYVDEGAPAHFPNYSNIADRMRLSLSEAFAVAKAISRRPTKATKFAETTSVKADKLFYDTVDRMVALAIK